MEVKGSSELVGGGVEDDACVDIVIVESMAGDSAGDVAHGVLTVADDGEVTVELASHGTEQGLSVREAKEAMEEDEEGHDSSGDGEHAPWWQRPLLYPKSNTDLHSLSRELSGYSFLGFLPTPPPPPPLSLNYSLRSKM